MARLMVWEKAARRRALALTGLGWLLLIAGHSAVIAVRAWTMPWSGAFFFAVDAAIILMPISMILRNSLLVLDGRSWIVAAILVELLVGAFLWTFLNIAVHLYVGGSC